MIRSERKRKVNMKEKKEKGMVRNRKNEGKREIKIDSENLRERIKPERKRKCKIEKEGKKR